MDANPITLFFNPACSKCREALRLLDERGIAVRRRDYLAEPPDRAELEALLARLGTGDPRVMMRTGDERYRALALDGAKPARLLDALAAEPALLQRPIAVRRGRALIARPPERVLDLLWEDEVAAGPGPTDP
jgi:arsenate reductase